ncbi:MAG TPA: hypothetical protein VGA00_06040 [Acidiferrobacterales bacterium]|jgi:hypothetical protein
MDLPARHLLFHAAVILLIGLFAGIPYGKAILGKKPESLVHAWRIAHGALALGAALMVALAAVVSSLQVSLLTKQALSVSFIVSGYGFAFALIVGPLVGARGLSSDGPISAKAVYVGNIVGVVGSLAGSFVLLYAAFVSL